RDCGPHDVVVGISASGVTPYVLGAVAYARELGAGTVGVTCNPEAPLREVVDVLIAPVVGPEVLAGSTRLKCGTAQKMVLNMLSTAAMVRLGRVEGNLMIDVRPTSAKLQQRAVRIICELTGASEEEAARALEEAGGVVRQAVEKLQGNKE
ncbi:MAG: N-acetylmuramic acid 6-phosphate etherase, partial [Armatimonadetes bacterium]|nr:N-acetylmuramic acid 6-phosphate etherase [Armatimonadota bacterium]